MDNSQKILIVDDDAHVLGLCAQILTQEGFSVVKASCGTEALKKIKDERPDFLIVDLILPDMNGAEIVQDARTKYACQSPVIFLTGMITKKEEEINNIQLKVKSQNYPAIAKPFDRVKFVELVKNEIKKVKK